MRIRLARRGAYAAMGLLLAFATGTFDSEARAILVALTYDATVTGGSFVYPTSVSDSMARVTVQSDHLSFSVAGDYSVLTDGSSSTVTVSIVTQSLTPDIQGSFNLNTSIDGFFAYVPASGAGTPPDITSYSATSTLETIAGSATVTLPHSPVPLSTAANFPNGGLELSGSQSSVVTIPPDVVYRGYLEQVTTITFDNVVAGETLQIQLPDTTSLTSVPEPGSLTPMLGGLLTICAAYWRKHKRSAGRSGA